MPRSGANLLLFKKTVFHPTSTASVGGHENPVLTRTIQHLSEASNLLRPFAKRLLNVLNYHPQ